MRNPRLKSWAIFGRPAGTGGRGDGERRVERGEGKSQTTEDRGRMTEGAVRRYFGIPYVLLAPRLLEELNRETLRAARPGTATTERGRSNRGILEMRGGRHGNTLHFFSEYSAYFAVAVVTSLQLRVNTLKLNRRWARRPSLTGLVGFECGNPRLKSWAIFVRPAGTGGRKAIPKGGDNVTSAATVGIQ